MVIHAIKIAVICYMFYFLQGDGEIFAWYRRLIEQLPEWLFKPLGGCFRCITGQVALWWFIFMEEYTIVNHLFFISMTIIFSMILDKLILYLNDGT